ncbi:Glutaredoxin [Aphelenchoides bicaudatus]|nr:Glutaredoxin [Aphelenchoides bicaudatus]
MRLTLFIFAFAIQSAFSISTSNSTSTSASIQTTTEASKNNAALTKEVHELIHQNTVTLFSKTYCPFSKGVKKILSTYPIKDMKVVELNLRNDTTLIQDELQKLSKIHTVPQLFVKGKFVGNYDAVSKMQTENKLRSILEDAKSNSADVSSLNAPHYLLNLFNRYFKQL